MENSTNKLILGILVRPEQILLKTYVTKIEKHFSADSTHTETPKWCGDTQ